MFLQFNKIQNNLKKRITHAHRITKGELIALGALLTVTTATVIPTSRLDASSNAVVTEVTTITPDDSVSQDEPELMDDEDVLVVLTTIPSVEDNEKVQNTIEDEARLQKTLEKKIANTIEQEKIDKIKRYINSIVCDPSDVSRVTNLNKEDYYYLTQGTWWAGHEDALYDLEHNHGISALFAMSVSTLESASGTSARANSKHNYYGLELPTVWSGLYANTQWWGNLIKESYVGCGRKSVWQIGPKYCPPNRDWESFNSNRMHKLYTKLISRLKKTYL